MDRRRRHERERRRRPRTASESRSSKGHRRCRPGRRGDSADAVGRVSARCGRQHERACAAVDSSDLPRRDDLGREIRERWKRRRLQRGVGRAALRVVHDASGQRRITCLGCVQRQAARDLVFRRSRVPQWDARSLEDLLWHAGDARSCAAQRGRCSRDSRRRHDRGLGRPRHRTGGGSRRERGVADRKRRFTARRGFRSRICVSHPAAIASRCSRAGASSSSIDPAENRRWRVD